MTLTTDFGFRDGYVGAMRGILAAATGPSGPLRCVDIAHGIAPQDVRGGAVALRRAAPHFPPGTVHLAVVDPGVGTDRAPLALLAGGHAFVGPDNGLFDWVTGALGGADGAWRIEAHPWLPASPAPTFHGRDIFAPTAAALATGRLLPSAVGPPVTPLALALPAVRALDDGRLIGEVVSIDHFGNLVTNIGRSDLTHLAPPAAWRVEIAGRPVPVADAYGHAPPGHLVALIGSDGWLEIAVRDGHAAERLELDLGARVTVRFDEPPAPPAS
ncbi:MAG: SAM-dependent chlorinase/fluorinase [Myxococcota bacterium]